MLHPAGGTGRRAGREAGLLAAVQVSEGQMVQEGQLLAQIDDTEARLAEEQAGIDIQIARANATNDVNLRFARKSVEVAKAELQRAEQSNQSFAKSVSDSEMDRLQLVVERSFLEVEQSQHEQTIAGFTLQARESQPRSVQEKVQRHKLLAPFGGVVVQIKRHRGEWVTPGEAVVRILRIDRLRAEAISRHDAGPDLQGTAVQLKVDLPGAPGTLFPGKIVFLDPEIDPVNAQIRVWAEVENTGLRLRPGMRASMQLEELARPPAQNPKPQANRRTPCAVAGVRHVVCAFLTRQILHPGMPPAANERASPQQPSGHARLLPRDATARIPCVDWDNRIPLRPTVATAWSLDSYRHVPGLTRIVSMARDDFEQRVMKMAAKAVCHYWKTRATQRKKQSKSGRADQGLRSAVTGVRQMDGFIDLFTELIALSGIPPQCVHSKDASNFRASSGPPRNGICLSSARTLFSSPSKRNHRLGRRSVTTSTIEPKRRWEAPSTFGPPIAGARLSRKPSTVPRATSSCWRTATHPGAGQGARAPFQGLSGVRGRSRTAAGTNSSAGNSFLTPLYGRGLHHIHSEDGQHGRIRDASGRPFP